jgi:hypothetical protein
MAITANSARAYHGLQANAEPTSEGTTGTLSIGQGATVTTLTNATQAIVLGIELDSTYDVEFDTETLIPTITGAGVNQVETATAAGTITASGNATVIVTGDDIVGSPLTVSVAVINTDTAATWAGKVRTALGSVSAITSLYTVGGSTTAITLTRIVKRYDDSTLNISLNNGTCTGITPALTSASTTLGVNPAKCYRISGTTYVGDNFEGADFANVDDFQGFQVRHTAGIGLFNISVTTGNFADLIAPGETVQKFSATSGDMGSIINSGTITFTGTANYCKAIVTFIFD